MAASEVTNPPTLLAQALLDTIRQAGGAMDLADRLKVPVSWVYEQSRQGNIPTHRIGRYLRFSLTEVLESQKNKNGP